MTKKEFLTELRNALTGEVPESEIRQHIDYYDLWLTNKAKSIGEEGATGELGSPLLIAKTLINDYKMQHKTNLRYDYSAGTETSSSANSYGYRSNSGSDSGSGSGSDRNNGSGYSGSYTASYDFNPGSSNGGSSYGSSSNGNGSDNRGYSGSYSNGKSYGSEFSNINVEDTDDGENGRRNKNHFIINGKTVNSVWARLGCLGCAILVCLILFFVAKAIIKFVFPIIIVAVLIFMAISLFRN